MLILGVTDGERPAAALVRNARLAAIHCAADPGAGPGYPDRVADRALATAGSRLDQVGRVVFGSHLAPAPRLDGLGRLHPSLVPPSATERLLRRGARWMRDTALEETGLWTVAASVRRRRQTERLQAGGFRGDVKTLDHYRSLSHAAWRCQPDERVLVVVASSDGDGTTLAVQVGDHDGLRLLYRQGGLSSLRAHVAAAADDEIPWRAAASLGERAADSLAPTALEEEFARQLHFVAGGFNLTLRAGASAFADVLRRHTPGEVAAACQANVVYQFRRLVHHWVRRSGISRLTVAGDVFANPGLCRALLAHDDVDRLFVLPADVPLAAAIGAAMRYGDAGPASLDSPYPGAALDDRGCEAALRRAGIAGRRTTDARDEAATRLLAGELVGWVAGPAALGVRALGHRSVLARPDDDGAVRRLAAAPSPVARASRTLMVRAELAAQAFAELDAAPDAVSLGSVPLRPSGWLRGRCPGLPGSPVLAQAVAREDSPDLHDILTRLEEGGGPPALLSADLRSAEDDDIDSPEAALLAFLDSHADALLLGPFTVERQPR
jgi:predicted NodU family carbamoyl transferase